MVRTAVDRKTSRLTDDDRYARRNVVVTFRTLKNVKDHCDRQVERENVGKSMARTAVDRKTSRLTDDDRVELAGVVHGNVGKSIAER
jgi:hypothetical protein